MLSGRFLGEVSAGDTCQNATAGLNCFGDTAEFVASVASRRHDAGDFESFLRNSTNSLFASCFNTAAAPLRPLRLLVLSGLEAATTVVLEPFVAKSKIPVTVLGMAYNDLHSLVPGPKVAAWSDMPPYSTARGSNFGKQVAQLVAMTSRISAHRLAPAAGVYNISRPVLSEAGRLSFYPDTWQELAAVMRQVNATASDPVTGRPRHALCIPVATDSSVVMYAVMASIMQTGDVTQGWLYDPLTLEPLTNNTAMLKASRRLQVLRIMWELSPFMRSFDSAITIDMGECAIALADSSVFKSLHIMYYNRNLMGQLTMSPLPASTEVLDRSTMQLVPCTAQLCNSQRATMLGGQLVNLAPSRYKAAQLIGLTHQVPQQLHKAVYDFIAFMGSPNVTQSYLRTPYSLDAPFRASAAFVLAALLWTAMTAALLVYKPGDPLAEPGAAAWKGMGYNYADVQSYAHALSSILALPYTAMDFRVADELKPLSYTQSALLALIGCSNPLVPRSAGSPADFAAAMTSMTSGLRAVRDSLGAAAFREQLWGTTGFVPPGLPPPPTPPSPSPPLAGGPALSTPLLATAIAVPVGVCLVVMVLLLVIITHLRRHAKLPRSLMGHVLPPGAGDKATLVITDVQGSSKLWELLPAGVMEASMKLHDELTRRLAVVNLGYEWATEGDSFLLCFHTPEAAVTFATQLQDALLQCSQWPVELLAQGSPGQPLCIAPVPRASSTAGSLCNNILSSDGSFVNRGNEIGGGRQKSFGRLRRMATATKSFSNMRLPFSQTVQEDPSRSPRPSLNLIRPVAISFPEGLHTIAYRCHAVVQTPITGLVTNFPLPAARPTPMRQSMTLRRTGQVVPSQHEEVKLTSPMADGAQGMHTGLAADEVLVQSRMGVSLTTYGGAALVLAKAVQVRSERILPCKSTVQITCSTHCTGSGNSSPSHVLRCLSVQLPVEELRSKGIGVVHAGEHLVALGEGRGSASVDLYTVKQQTPQHTHRSWALGPLRQGSLPHIAMNQGMAQHASRHSHTHIVYGWCWCRTLRQLQPGVLHAPVGSAAVAFMSVAGMAQLRAWNTELARECMALYLATAQRVLLYVSSPQLPAGYLVSTADEDGMVLAAFSSSLQCLHWALLTLTTCMDLDWPQALLDSLLGEEVVTRQFGQPTHWQPPLDTPAPMQPATLAHDTVSTDDITVQLGSLPAPPATQGKAAVAAAEVEPDRQSLRVTPSAAPNHFSVRLMRGLRLKAGVDAGEVAFEVTPATGRANYKGRCLNRAARINSLALSGQVWCPEPMWTAAASYKPQPAAHSQEQALDAVRLPACSPASWSSQGQRCESTLSILKSGTNRTMTPKMSVSFSHREPSLLGPLAPASCPDPAPAVLDVGSNSLGASQAGQCGPSALWDAAQQQLHTPLSPAAACCVGGNRSSVTLRTRGQPLALPDMLPPLVGQHLGQVELRGIPGQVALIQVSLATHTSRAQLEAADRLGLTAPGLQLSRAQ
ncbi:hypothetical protein QJQ45_014497 [Haematococcus lacustris]|nr:hypothetical protein QJQ45_014497 [Haematococcus lacustris]